MLRKWGVEGDWRGIGHCILGYPVSVKEAAPRKNDFVTIVR